MRIHLIRHGQTEMNAIQTIDTVYPGASLTAKGREQAQALVGRLEGIPFDSIYVSNLVRTHQTADPLARSRSITPIERDGFREVEAGTWERGCTEFDYKGYYSTMIRWMQGDLDECMGGGANGREVLDRYDSAIREIELTRAESVAIVSHGAVISYWAGLRGAGLTRYHCIERPLENTEMCVLEGSLDTGYRALTWMGEPVTL